MSDSVLVVHNSDEVYSFFKKMFEKEGYDVLSEKDCISAIKMLLERNPRIVFIESGQSVSKCIDLIKIVKSYKSGSITCFIGKDGPSNKSVMSAGADAFFEEPLDAALIKKTIDRLHARRLKIKKLPHRKKLYQTEAFLTHLLEHIRIAIISIDYAGNILSFNRKAQKIWGYQSNFVIGRNFDVLCIKDNRIKCAPLFISETLKDGSYEGVLLFERADGTKFPGKLETSIIKGEENDEGIVVVVRDLTKQRELEEQLLEKEKLATLGMVVEGVAHEVRNPLISIGGFARRILKKVKSDFPYRNYLKVIVDDVSRLEAMVKDIESYVHFMKLHKPNFKKGRIDKVLETALDLVEKNRWKNIKLVTEYDPTMPPVFLDVGYLVEMFFNLIENAIEAMGKKGTLTIKTLRDNHTLCIIKIIDTGCGIPDDKINEIFNLFYTTKMSGVGLGLAKSHIIVDEHGGRISIDSKKGAGTSVTVTLPLERRQKVRR